VILITTLFFTTKPEQATEFIFSIHAVYVLGVGSPIMYFAYFGFTILPFILLIL